MDVGISMTFAAIAVYALMGALPKRKGAVRVCDAGEAAIKTNEVDIKANPYSSPLLPSGESPDPEH
jgi:hypothetical protein